MDASVIHTVSMHSTSQLNWVLLLWQSERAHHPQARKHVVVDAKGKTAVSASYRRSVFGILYLRRCKSCVYPGAF